MNVLKNIAVSTIFFVLTVFLAYGAVRADFTLLAGSYSVLFTLYLYILFDQKKSNSQLLRKLADKGGIVQRPTWQNTMFYYIALGMALRVILLFNLPNLSEDAWRFLWDGRLTINGIHPFSHPPVYFIEHQIFPQGITPELFAHLNSKQWFSVYPPVCQAVFTATAWLSSENDQAGIIWLKLFLLFCEIGTIGLLWYSKRYFATLIWALNPLVLLEIMGNCHFEGALVFFLLLSLHALERYRIAWAAVALALATAVKLWPLMFIPLVFRWLGLNRGLWFCVVFTVVSIAMFLPMLDWAVLQNMGKSLDLYFQKFAFNGSVYYVFWEIGLQFNYYKLDKLIGVLLLPFPIMAIGWFFRRLSHKSPIFSLYHCVLWTFCIYLFFTSTVHPWYVTVLLALGIWMEDNERVVAAGRRKWSIPLFPIAWSGTVIFSYSHYENGAFIEQKGWIALEYLIVLTCLIWDINKNNVEKNA